MEWLVRGRGALAALAIHVAIVGVILTNDITPEPASPDPVLVSILEWPEAGTPDSNDGSAPDFSPKPLEDLEAAQPTERIPVSTPRDVVPDAARLADPVAPDRPSNSQSAPYSEMARGPVPQADADLSRRPPPPEVEFANPYLNYSPGPAQRVVRAVQCARLTPSQRVNCPTQAMEEAAIAMIVADARSASTLYDPFFDVFVANDAMSRIRARQSDPTDGPYRMRSARSDPMSGFQHRQVASSAANQASADMAGRIISRPDPVWGD